MNMKLFKYALLLIVLIGFVSVADAAHTHAFDGSKDPKETTKFLYGTSNILDTVTVGDSSGKTMEFYWYDPSGDFRGMTVDSTIVDKKFSAGLYTGQSLDEEGQWHVHSKEYKQNGDLKEEGDGYFYVAPFPEFSIGSFLSILIVGFLYLALRRNMAVS